MIRNKISKLSLFLLIFAILGCNFFVLEIQEIKSAGIPAPWGLLYGIVTSAETNQGLAGVDLKLLDTDNYIGECPAPEELLPGTYCENGYFGWQALSQDDGSYSISPDLCSTPGQTIYLDLFTTLDGYEQKIIQDISIACWGTKEVNVSLNLKQPEPVILIPGIMGSYQTHGLWTVDPILGVYDSLWQALKNHGYVESQSLFAFPYNWRDYNANTASLLKQKIQDVKDVTGKQKVDLIGHSMGGIVARAYIQSAEYQNDVDQLIFLGTPHLGSPEAYMKYEALAGFEPPDRLIILAYFQLEALRNGYLDLVKYVQEKVPALRELLPIYDYLKKKVNDEWVFRQYPLENYVQNTFLENLNTEPAIETLKQRVQITNIVSDYTNEGTIVSIRTVSDPDPTDLKWVHGYPENYDDETGDQGLEKGKGDHTVPDSSAIAIPDIEPIYCENGPIHRAMPTECQRHVIWALKGIWPDEIYRANLIQKLLMIYVHSPVEFQIIDEQGNVTGFDFENDGYFENIPDSLFDDEYGFVFIQNPTNQEYKIKVLGTGQGEYKLVVSEIDDNSGQDSITDGIINNGELKGYYFDYDPDSELPLEIEEEQITIDDVIQDIKDIIAQDGFKHSSLGYVLINLLEKVKSWQKSLEQTVNWIKQIVFKKMILRTLNQIKNILGNWFNKNKISQEGYDILTNDINILIQQF